MKRPLVWVLLFYIVGVVIGRYFQDGIALCLVAILVFTGVLYYRNKNNIILLFPLLSLLGFILVFSGLSIKNMDIEKIARDEANVHINATVLEAGKSKSGKYKAIVLAKEIIDTSGKIHNVEYKIQVYFSEGLKANTGDKVVLIGKLSPLENLRNPGGYNEFQYLHSRKIEYKLFASGIEKTGTTFGTRVFIASMRERISQIFEKSLPQAEAEFMKSIIIGDNGGLDDFTQDLYRKAGIYHILVVSGLHVSIVYMFFYSVFLYIFGIRITRYLLIVLLVFYCVLTGAGVSTTRSVIMCITGIVASMLGREQDGITTTSFAALCLLIYEPFYLWDIGFQYSFCAVFGLIVGTKAIENWFYIIKNNIPATNKFFENKYIKKYLSSVIAASIATIPINIYYFYYFSPISILVNLIIVPSSFLIVILGILICIDGFISLPIASFLGMICVLIIKIYEITCLIAVSIPFANILTGAVSLYFIASLVFVIVCLCYLLYRQDRNRKIIFYSSLSLFLIILVATAFSPKQMILAMLDVGQGDGFVISKGKAAILIDGGGNIRKGVGNNVGKNIIIPYLDNIGTEWVEAVFVSHLDGDHIIGAIETIQNKKVKRLFLTYNANNDKNNNYYDIIIDAAKKNNTEINLISAGDKFIFAKGITVECIYPKKNSDLVDNDGSMILKISHGNNKFLFVGDAGFPAEKAMLDSNADIDVDVLKIGHHGSKYSTKKDFLDAVSPSIALISAGKNNTYGHPSQSVLEELYEEKTEVFSTIDSGAVFIKSDGDKIEVKQMISK